jgi:hypothetical protein
LVEVCFCKGCFTLAGNLLFPFRLRFSFKSLYETGEIKGTFALITRPGNELLRKIHNSGSNAYRMPLFLPNKLEQTWLLPDLSDEEIKEVLSFEWPAEKLKYYPVYTIRTTKPRPDDKSILEPYDWPDLPELGQRNPDRKEAAIKDVD